MRSIGRALAILAFLVLILVAARVLATVVNERSGARAEQPERGAARGTTDREAGTPIANIGSGGELDGGWYQLYFTAPKYPDNRANHKGGLDEKLVALIDTARTSVDVAVYDFDLANLADALARAKGRGVAVRMVTDSDTLNDAKNKEIQAALGKLRAAGIPIVGDGRGPIMHHKFTVVDRQTVSTGSWNYTDGDTYRLNNNMIVIESPELAANYTDEFNEMFEKKRFGPNKDKGVPNPVVTIDGTRIETVFAAQGPVEERIIATLRGAQRSISFLAFSFTDDEIAQAMLDRRAAGVALAGVFETTGSNTEFSEFGKMKERGVPVYQDGNPWVMHHKVIIIDERIVIFGSYNFSNNAATQNDENLLIVENPDIARAFKAEYDRILALAQNPPPKKR